MDQLKPKKNHGNLKKMGKKKIFMVKKKKW
jgi:hypothetical protein